MVRDRLLLGLRHHPGGQQARLRVRRAWAPEAGEGMTDPTTPIVEQLIAAREVQGITQSDLSRRMWRQRCMVSYLERHEKEPRLSTLTEWAEALGLRIVVSLEEVDGHDQQ